MHEADLPSPAALAYWNLDPAPGALLETVAGNVAPSPSGATEGASAVVSLGPFTPEAELLARHSGRSSHHCENGAELMALARDPSLEDLAVVTDLENLSYEILGDLITSPAATGEGGPQLGFLTGATRQQVGWSVSKALLLASRPHRGRTLCLLASPGEDAPTLFSDAEMLWLEDLEPQRLQAAASREWDVAVLLSHSNGVDGNFGRAILCPIAPGGDEALSGAPPGGATGSRLEGAPSCLGSTLCQRDPQASRYRFHPHDLRADVVLYDTCAGFLTTGAFASPTASLGLAFLSGTPGAIVTSFRKKTCSELCTVLFRALLEDGYSLGRITQLLNLYQRLHFSELPSFLLLGDPALRRRRPAAGSEEVEISEDGVRVGGWHRHTLPLRERLGDEVLVPGADSGVLVADFERVCRGEGLWLLRPRAGQGSVELRRRSRRALLGAELELGRRLRRSLPFLEILTEGLRGHVAESAIEALAEVAAEGRRLLPAFDRLGQHAQLPLVHGQLLAELRGAAGWLRERVEALDRDLLDAWVGLRQWLVLHHFYTHSLDPGKPEEMVPAACPVCASRVTRKRSVQADRPEVARDMYTCIRCGVLADVTANEPMPVVAGADRCAPGDEVLYLVDCGAQTGLPGKMAAHAYFGGFGAAVVRAAPPRAARHAVVREHGHLVSELSCRIAEDCPPGLYSFVVVGCCGLALWTAARYLTVHPCGSTQAVA